ncbi:uncharacterized protein LOC135699805 [Ochlerotatus camptorhynchus]|uniref:uncharacterized protein LOC135699805 n=1 Tax=Ochlerotatus camptorhynchus TaxID=644619 RepID=UPI0031D07CD9
MFNIAKEHAFEVDTKLRILRKKTANFACGYIQQDPNKLESAKQFIAVSGDSLEEIETSCLGFTAGTDELERLLVEADETADKIFARLSEFYADCRYDMPPVEDEELPVGIPLAKLVLDEPETTDESQDVTNSSGLPNASETETDDEFKPNVFISRPSDSGGPPSWTPMIKARKNIF